MQLSNYRCHQAHKHLLVRVIKYPIPDPHLSGYGQPHRLVTTLLDPEAYPIPDLICFFSSAGKQGHPDGFTLRK